MEYDPSGNSNLSLHVGADILNLLLLCELFMFFHVFLYLYRFDYFIVHFFSDFV